MKIFEKANELALEIKETKEYRELIDSKCKLDNDEEATSLIRDMRLLQEEYIKTVRENIDKDAVASMENLLKSKHQEILDNEITHRYIIAKEVFDALMKQINKTLADGIALKTKESGCENCGGCN
ncbi:MAG: YlbF family regulator [Clostridia bacterium]|nr:YlbF family regulator [Clostridia bacterium]